MLTRQWCWARACLLPICRPPSACASLAWPTAPPTPSSTRCPHLSAHSLPQLAAVTCTPSSHSDCHACRESPAVHNCQTTGFFSVICVCLHTHHTHMLKSHAWPLWHLLARASGPAHVCSLYHPFYSLMSSQALPRAQSAANATANIAIPDMNICTRVPSQTLHHAQAAASEAARSARPAESSCSLVTFLDVAQSAASEAA